MIRPIVFLAYDCLPLRFHLQVHDCRHLLAIQELIPHFVNHLKKRYNIL